VKGREIVAIYMVSGYRLEGKGMGFKRGAGTRTENAGLSRLQDEGAGRASCDNGHGNSLARQFWMASAHGHTLACDDKLHMYGRFDT
jgi:hypothetical protein